MSLILNGVTYDYINDEVAKIVGYNFSGMDLSGTTIEGLSQPAKFIGANLSNAVIQGVFSGSDFSLAVMKDTVFERGAQFFSCIFSGAMAYGTSLAQHAGEDLLNKGVQEALKKAAIAVVQEPINLSQQQIQQPIIEAAGSMAFNASTNLTQNWPQIAAWTAVGVIGAIACSKLWYYWTSKPEALELDNIGQLNMDAANALEEAGREIDQQNNDAIIDLEEPEEEIKPKKGNKNPKKRHREDDPENQEPSEEGEKAPEPKRPALNENVQNQNNPANNADADDMDVAIDMAPAANPPANLPVNPDAGAAQQVPVAQAPNPPAPGTPIKARIDRRGLRELGKLLEHNSPSKNTRNSTGKGRGQ